MQTGNVTKTALITGASSGIGRDLSTVFAREGYDLVITARREERLQEIKNELENKFNNRVDVYACDLSENDAPKKLYQFITGLPIRIDTLVNNAGIGDYGFFCESDWEKNATMLNLNITSLTHLTHLFLPDLMSHEKSYIMNVASTAAFQPGPLMSVYYASKHYVLAFSEAITNEVKDKGVVVSALCPDQPLLNFKMSQTWKNQNSSTCFRLHLPSK